MRRFFAAIKARGFESTWDVLAFDSKKARDLYVEEADGYNQRTQQTQTARAIKKSEVTRYAVNYSVAGNKFIRPKPFSGECWMISPVYADPDFNPEGFLGFVVVGHPDGDQGERLF